MNFSSQNIQVRAYLKTNSGVFRRVDEFRERVDIDLSDGWQAPSGDQYFKKQRENADNKDDNIEQFFHHLHLKIGRELREVGAFEVNGSNPSDVKTLQLCLAPGAYTTTVLEQYPEASVCGVTLPVEAGGHKIMIPYGSQDPRVAVEFMDITMLVGEFFADTFSIPQTHPDAQNFILKSPFADTAFDLVLCDGQALRVHERAGKKEDTEPLRLLTAQLVFGMARMKPGGTFVMLLHKADAYDTVLLLKKFCSFANVTLFKPSAGHRQRSTFYMIAKDVQPTSLEAQRCIAGWKEIWIQGTFGGENGTGVAPKDPDAAEVDALLNEFGPKLIEMAHEVWTIQTEALSHSKWLPQYLKASESPPESLQGSSKESSSSTRRYPNSVLGQQSPLAAAQWSSSSTRQDENQSPVQKPHGPSKDKLKQMASSWR
ncbi:MAG: hypothetical protein LQ343_002924 [Gyalolechia ehrenbergii]|nr:MAG: hypothetical protein LQ343_002924 [Gyalolechia ehrenbergii]